MSTSTVQVLLATYNGEKFIRQQIESLLAQTCQDFEIIVADDGSTDSTLGIIEEIAGTVPGKIRIEFREPVGGAARNFMRLIDIADAPYVMCCDQDDVWLPEKVETLLVRCRDIERLHPGYPVLVHSDLSVVDETLNVLHPSMFEYQQLKVDGPAFRDLLLQSCVTGCAMVMNRPLLQLTRGSDPDRMIMHDWWISLTASAFGIIDVVRVPTVLYRQHGANTIGASRAGIAHFVRRVSEVARGGKLNRHIRRCFPQARAFLQRYGSQLKAAQYGECGLVAALQEQSPFKLRYTLLRHGLLNQGLVRNIVTLIVI